MLPLWDAIGHRSFPTTSSPISSTSAACADSLSFLLDLSLLVGKNIIPVEVNLLEVLQKLWSCLLPLEVAQILLPIAEHRIEVDLVLHRQLESTLPPIDVEIHLDGSVDQRWRGLQEDALCLVGLAAEESQLRLTTFLRRNRADVLHILDLGHLSFSLVQENED